MGGRGSSSTRGGGRGGNAGGLGGALGDMPELTGSERQIAWAEDIRQKVIDGYTESSDETIAYINRLKSNNDPLDDSNINRQTNFQKDADARASMISEVTSAKEWIEHRNNAKEYLNAKYAAKQLNGEYFESSGDIAARAVKNDRFAAVTYDSRLNRPVVVFATKSGGPQSTDHVTTQYLTDAVSQAKAWLNKGRKPVKTAEGLPGFK